MISVCIQSAIERSGEDAAPSLYHALGRVRAGRRFLAGLGFVLACLCCSGTVEAAPAPLALPQNLPDAVTLQARQTTGAMTIPINKSQLLRVDRPFGEISVGNKDIADVVPLTRNLVYVLGKKHGATNLTLSDNSGNVLAVVDVVVTFDVESLRQSFAALVPDEHISIRPAGDALVLSGQVSSPDRLRQILAVAERYAPGAVTNLLTLGASQQVLLQVRFAEIQRNAEQDLGANLLAQLTPAEGTFTFASGLATPPTAFGVISGLITRDTRYNLNTTLNALEKKGLLRTLAEPNLVALSGDTASFLAGGQIPIPSPQSSAAQVGGVPIITVQFKDFGVSLAFTPTVVGKELINLEIVSEVSQIDPTLAINTGIVSIPGLKVRRARTTVEMKDGQSFSIAGLLQDDYQNGVEQFPILGNIPILGALFRSTNFQHQQSELVVLITAHLVDPGVAKSLATPAEAVILPSPLSLFGKGQTEEGQTEQRQTEQRRGTGEDGKGAGINATPGYVLP